MAPLLSGAGNLVTNGMEETEVFRVFFASVFSGKTSLQEAPETQRKVWSREDLPLVEKGLVRKH